MKKSPILALTILLSPFGLLQTSSATVFILDSTNNYSVNVGSGSTISQPAWLNDLSMGTVPAGTVVFTGFTVAFGGFEVADFTSGTFSSVGGVAGGSQPSSLVNQTLTLLEDSTGDLFEAEVTFFRSPRGANSGAGFVGVLPDVDNTAGFSFELTQIPEPSSSFLVGMASLVLLRRRRSFHERDEA